MQSFENVITGPDDPDFQILPKILLLGKICQGKSSLIKQLAKESFEIQIGDGSLPYTNEIQFYKVTLRGTS